MATDTTNKNPLTLVKELAQTAHLSLNAKEITTIANQLQEAWQAVKTLQSAPVNQLPPLTHPTLLTNVTRPDKVTPSLSQQEALSQAKRTYQGYFITQSILKHK